MSRASSWKSENVIRSDIWNDSGDLTFLIFNGLYTDMHMAITNIDSRGWKSKANCMQLRLNLSSLSSFFFSSFGNRARNQVMYGRRSDKVSSSEMAVRRNHQLPLVISPCPPIGRFSCDFLFRLPLSLPFFIFFPLVLSILRCFTLEVYHLSIYVYVYKICIFSGYSKATWEKIQRIAFNVRKYCRAAESVGLSHIR